MGWPSARSSTLSPCGVSDVLPPPIWGRWAAGWWKKGVRSVSMQSTGVYWMPVLEVLEQQGLEVCLVNAQHTKNVRERNSDVLCALNHIVATNKP
jgi:transposase